MAQKTGGQTIADLRSNRFQSPVAYGLDAINQIIQADLAAHNKNVQDMLGGLCDFSADKQRITGSSGAGSMKKGTEWTRDSTQHVALGSTLGFPMELNTYALGWTKKWLQTRKVADMAEQVDNAKIAHLKMLQYDIQRAFFLSSNYTFRDRLDSPQIDLDIKRLCNADSFPIPDGPNAETFTASSHTHYLGTGSLVNADVVSLINTVVEHGHGADVRLCINVAQEAAVKALADFIKATPVYVTPADNSDRLLGQRLDVTVLNDRFIGTFGAAQVWVKPWVPASYLFAYSAGDARKPLVCRTRDGGAPALVIAAELDTHPLQAEYMESEYGVGVWTRTNGAVLYTANATYADPSLSA